MNKQPINYLQTDKRWKNLPYRVKGETATIGGSGCGPTSAAMIIETITGQTFTPVDACKWSCDHGYKALNAGTYQSYFVPQFAAMGIESEMLKSLDHDRVKAALNEGYYAVALMGKGLWTSGGHYIVVWDWNDKVRINDSASKRVERNNGDPERFKKEVRKYWLVDAREYNKGDDEMLSYEQFKMYMDQYLKELNAKPVPDWAVKSNEWERARKLGIITSTSYPQASMSKAETAAMILRGLDAAAKNN